MTTQATPCSASCGHEATLTVDNTIPSNRFPSIPLEKHVPVCAPCWSEMIDPGAMHGKPTDTGYFSDLGNKI